jgi:hypothetical protein
MIMKDSDMMSCPVIGCEAHLTKNDMRKHLVAYHSILQITEELISRQEIEERQQKQEN